MTDEHDGAPPQSSPPTPKNYKTESEEEPTGILKDEDHSEEESRQIEDNDEDEDGPPPGWHHSPPLLDMIDFPPLSTLPPTPPLFSSPRDFEMEQDSDEDDGPPPGWHNKYQLKEQTEQLVTVAVDSAVSSDIQTEGVRPDTHNEEGETRSQSHPCLPPEGAPSGIKVEEHDSEDDGPPPGWDSKCQPEPKLQSSPRSDMKMDDVPQDAQKEECQSTPEVPSDKIEDREYFVDEGPPPGWDSECQPEAKLQKNSQSDSSDIKADFEQQDARNETGPQSQSHLCFSPAPELVPTDTKVEEDSEDDGPPPGWNLKCQLEPNLRTACPATPPSDFKIEEDKEDARDNEGSPPGWGSNPQQQSHVHSSLPSPIVQSGAGTGYEPNNVKIIEESPQPLSRQRPIYPTKPQSSVPQPPTTMNNPEMGQMVCGSCRHLLSYPRGARYVECACCLEENYVLEEHEVGQVVCGGCNVLLMYPHGAPKVRCANCRAETEIGDQNRRPPLSEHKRRARQRLRCVQAG